MFRLIAAGEVESIKVGKRRRRRLPPRHLPGRDRQDPLRPQSMTLSRDRPEILTPPEHPPACCANTSEWS